MLSNKFSHRLAHILRIIMRARGWLSCGIKNRGSEKTADHVREEIARRYGEEEAEEYDPQTNCFTLPTWNKLGYRVRKGEKSIRSITLIEKADPNAKEGEQSEV